MKGELLDRNEAFYEAIRLGDYPAMDLLWSRRRQVTCTHPGWTRIAGREAVMDSWRMILTEQEPPPIYSTDHMPVITGTTAMVVCSERIGGAALTACNAFVRENGTWCLINHQAAQIPLQKAH